MNGPTPATEVLRDEHRWILEVADVLERVVEAEAMTEALDLEAAEKCVRFIRLFADACHHGKEEDLLFTEMERVGMSRSSGPIAVMLEEHRIGREYVAVMQTSLDAARAGDQAAVRSFVSGAYDYIQLIRNHILKEDHVLFDIADRVVDGPACRSLCTAYEGVCAQRFEGCTKAQLEDLARELLERYPPAGI